MDYRLRHLQPAAWRIVRRKAGDQLDAGLRRLIELWAAGPLDPLSETDPLGLMAREAEQLVARGRLGGMARAKALSPDQRRAIAKRAARVRWDSLHKPIRREGDRV